MLVGPMDQPGASLQVSVDLPILVAGGTPAAWATPSSAASPAQSGRRLVIHATVAVLSPDQRPLQSRARELGFADLAGYLADRYLHREASLISIADELGTTIHVVRGLRDRLGISSHGGVRARGSSREAGNERRATARAVAWGWGSAGLLGRPLHHARLDDPAACRGAWRGEAGTTSGTISPE
jgi:hypothetical protein